MRSRSHDSESREQSIMAWLPLVRCIAFEEFRRLGGVTRILVIDLDDLVQTGALGLMTAVDRFNPSLAAPATYFGRRIRGAIHDFLRSFPYVRQGEVMTRADEAELEFHPVLCRELVRTEVRVDLSRLASRLSSQQRRVVDAMSREIPQHRIARKLGVTAGRVSQIKRECLAALRSAALSEQSKVEGQN